MKTMHKRQIGNEETSLPIRKIKTVLNITLELSITYTYPSFRFCHHFKSVHEYLISILLKRIPSHHDSGILMLADDDESYY